MNEREARQGKVVTMRPRKRLAQVRSSLMSDPLPAEHGSHKFNSKILRTVPKNP